MRIERFFFAAVVLGATLNGRAAQSGAPEPRFDVVSIKRNMSDSRSQNWQVRPDGGLRAVNMTAMQLVAKAYAPQEVFGSPDWMKKEHYDVIATSTLSHATDDEQRTMMRGLLTERFKLVVHME